MHQQFLPTVNVGFEKFKFEERNLALLKYLGVTFSSPQGIMLC